MLLQLNHLPLDAICRTIERNLRELLDRSQVCTGLCPDPGLRLAFRADAQRLGGEEDLHASATSRWREAPAETSSVVELP